MNHPDKEFWNARYRALEFAYGTEPNDWLAEKLAALPPGRILLPMEGEGRNAVFAAERGWEVIAFDFCEEGRSKAMRLAASRGVEIDYRLCAVEDFPFPEGHFDAVAFIFGHLQPDIRQRIHRRAATSLRPGGHFILEAFHPRQLGRSSGGPKALELLYTEETISDDLADLETLELLSCSTELHEGPYHQGAAEVLRYLGRRI